MTPELKAELSSGLTFKAALRMAEQARDKATAEIERLRSARGVEADGQHEAIQRGQPGLRVYMERGAQFDLQEQQLVRSLAEAKEKLRLLRTQEAKEAFALRDAEVVREQDLRRTAICEAEALMVRAAQALTSNWNPPEAVTRGFLQRFGDLLSVSWADGQVSPAVRNRSNERLSSIFTGSRAA